MSQMLLLPDPRPLVERLGSSFFRQAPESPGVYLMRDRNGLVIYVGKAKNLRRRLGSYRVANPDRLRRRHLRLLHAAVRIDLELCPDEPAALARESELLRQLRPRFNRAGTWPAPPRYHLSWRLIEAGLELAVLDIADPAWRSYGPLGRRALLLRASLARLLRSAVHPACSVTALPAGWFGGRTGEIAPIPHPVPKTDALDRAAACLEALAQGDPAPLIAWVRERAPEQVHPFDLEVREADLETVAKCAGVRPGIKTPAMADGA